MLQFFVQYDIIMKVSVGYSLANAFCSEEQNQAQAKLVFDFDRTYNEKIVKCEARLTARPAGFLSDGNEENIRIYAVHLTTADQSGICRAHLVLIKVTGRKKWKFIL